MKRAWTILGIGVVALVGCSSDDTHRDQIGAEEPAKLETTCADVVDKLSGCGLISGLHLKGCADGERLTACVNECVSNASCAQMQAGYCDEAFNGFSGCLNECQTAPPPDYVCSDATTIPASWRCDGGDDCPDGKDEDCPEGSFSCEDGLSVPAGWKCDTVDDCAHGEDELDCPGSSKLSCNDGTRIPTRRQCDGSEDCADGEDELDCVELTCE